MTKNLSLLDRPILGCTVSYTYLLTYLLTYCLHFQPVTSLPVSLTVMSPVLWNTNSIWKYYTAGKWRLLVSGNRRLESKITTLRTPVANSCSWLRHWPDGMKVAVGSHPFRDHREREGQIVARTQNPLSSHNESCTKMSRADCKNVTQISTHLRVTELSGDILSGCFHWATFWVGSCSSWVESRFCIPVTIFAWVYLN